MRKRIFGLEVGLGVLALAGAVWGQASGGVVTINGGRNTILMRTPSEPFVALGFWGRMRGSRGRSGWGADSGPKPIIR
jgi:hypothetical protein